MNRFKYTLLVSGLGSNMAERRAWAWICRCFTISFGRCRCWVSRSPPWPGTRLRCGPTSSWLISPLPGGCFSVVFLVFYVAFLQKWPALASGGCYSHFPHWSHLQVELRTRALCSVPGSWTMQARDGTSRDISVPWMGTTSPGGSNITVPTSNDEHFLPLTAIIWDLTAGSPLWLGAIIPSRTSSEVRHCSTSTMCTCRKSVRHPRVGRCWKALGCLKWIGIFEG